MPEIKAPAPQPTRGLSQQQKIVAQMCKHHETKWWLPQDFMKGGQFFVGYEASARLSELQSENPLMFETERAGKFKQRRIRFEDAVDWYPAISKELRYVVDRHMTTGAIAKPHAKH